jgi:bifunctional ADP-heptose synthase (sugar kinase/adenylyltransferase)
VPAHVRQIADVSGAGDTVVSIAALCLALKLSPPLLAGLSNLGGGLVCEYSGVVPVNKHDLLREAVGKQLFRAVPEAEGVDATLFSRNPIKKQGGLPLFR